MRSFWFALVAVWCFGSFTGLVLAQAPMGASRTWTCKDGTTHTGTLVQTNPAYIRIETPEGKKIKIKIENVSDADLKHVETLKKKASEKKNKDKEKDKGKKGAKPARPVLESFTDEDVERAIKKGVEFLWSMQKKDGSWPLPNHFMKGNKGNKEDKFLTGYTAFVCYALLECDQGANDPRMIKALKWMIENRDKDKKNYSVAFRCQVWLHANRQTNDKYRKVFEKEVQRMVVTATLSNGGSSYETFNKAEANEKWKTAGEKGKKSMEEGGGRADNSNSQYNLLGLWAGLQNNMEIPPGVWRRCLDFWMVRQWEDGGWGYYMPHKDSVKHRNCSYGPMTVAGLASLYVCFDVLFADQFIKCVPPRGKEWQAMQRGLGWLDKEFPRSLTKPRGNEGIHFLYYLYGVERVGLASGYRYFGAIDWYKEGAKYILAAQRENGAWGGGNSLSGTGYALLFLIRGRQPLLFNKLEVPSFDWNNRPRDCANLTRWISRRFESRINWQIITLKSPVNDWHDAPILYLSGSKKPVFTDPELEKLRRYVLQGGTILGVTECGGTGFRGGIRKVYQKLFPKLELVPVGKDHELMSIHFKLRGRPKLYMMHNGIRPVVIHCDQDLPKEWQLNKGKTVKWAFEAPANIYLYLTDRGALKYRGSRSWPDLPKETTRTARIARIRHAGRCDPEPLAYERFVRLMGNKYGLKLELAKPKEKPKPEKIAGKIVEAKVESEVWDALIPAAELADHPDVKFAHLTGTSTLSLTAEEKAALKTFVAGGGTLLIDAAGGSRSFTDAARKFITATWDGELATLDAGHALYNRADVKIQEIKFRRQSKTRFGKATTPKLQAVTIDNRPAVIFSDLDLTAGLVGFESFSMQGYMPNSSFDLLRNIVLHATGIDLPRAEPDPPKNEDEKPKAKPEKPKAEAKKPQPESKPSSKTREEKWKEKIGL